MIVVLKGKNMVGIIRKGVENDDKIKPLYFPYERLKLDLYPETQFN